MDGHTPAGQVDFHIGNLPRCLDAKNLSVELTVVHENGLEAGPAGSLSEAVNPHRVGKSHFVIHQSRALYKMPILQRVEGLAPQI